MPVLFSTNTGEAISELFRTFTLKMEAAVSSETLVSFSNTTWRHSS